ncbi:hypothetical protein V8E55_004610 [Tylopilus felleus]
MSTVFTESYSHSQEKQRSYNNLQQSCQWCANQAPYPWQLDVAFILGLDCTVIAGTGSGKTLPFLMPAMLHHDGILMVLSPLNSLEEDQVA